jgi:hypothetical protein
MRRDSNDRDAVGWWRQRADAQSRLNTVENRHLHVHKDDVISTVADGVDRLLAVLDDIDLMPGRAQDHRGQLLIDLVVLGDKDMQQSRSGWHYAQDTRGRGGGAEQPYKGIEQ